MKELRFKCNKDGSEFTLESGITKSETLNAQEKGEDTSLLEKIRIGEQFDAFVQSVIQHTKTCDGLVAVNVSTYRIVD